MTITLPLSVEQTYSIAVCGGIGTSGWEFLNGVGIKGTKRTFFDLWHSFGNTTNAPITWISVGY